MSRTPRKLSAVALAVQKLANDLITPVLVETRDTGKINAMASDDLRLLHILRRETDGTYELIDEFHDFVEHYGCEISGPYDGVEDGGFYYLVNKRDQGASPEGAQSA